MIPRQKTLSGSEAISVELERLPTAWSCPLGRPRYSVELRAAPAWSCPSRNRRQRGPRSAGGGRDRLGLPVTRNWGDVVPATAWSFEQGAARGQRGAATVNIRGNSYRTPTYSVELPKRRRPGEAGGRASVELIPRHLSDRNPSRSRQPTPPPAKKWDIFEAQKWAFSIPLQRGAAPAWSCPRQIPLQRGAGARRLQRGAGPRQTPLQRGAAGGWSSAPPAWSCPWSRLQRGAAPGRSRYSVELGGPSVELPPTDPATAWSSAAPAWSCRQQIPLQRGARRLQRGADPGRPCFSVELGGSSVELAPADLATAWSWAASAWSWPRQTLLQRGAGRLQRGAAPGRPRYSVELGGSSAELRDPSVEFTPSERAERRSRHV